MDPDASFERRIGRGATAIRALICHSEASRAAQRLVGDCSRRASAAKGAAQLSSGSGLCSSSRLLDWTTRRFGA